MKLRETLDVLPTAVREKAKEGTIHVKLRLNGYRGGETYVVEDQHVCLPRMNARLDLSMALIAEWYALENHGMRVFSMESITELAPNHLRIKFIMIPHVEGEVNDSY